MASLAPSFVITNPSYIAPEIILPYSQASGAFNLVAGGAPLTRMSDGDLYAYVKRIDVRTQIGSGQSAYNLLPSISTTLSMISTPSYLMRVRTDYDHHDVAANARWGVSLPEAQRLGMRQAHFQQARTALLYGFQPQNGEGLVNTQGATAVSLPADSYGNTTIQTYDNGQLALFFLQQIGNLKSRTNQIGHGVAVVILLPQRILSALQYAGVVQLVNFQRPGAGVQTIAGMVKDVAGWSDDDIMWEVDDTLIGKGAGGTDAIVMNMPEVEKPVGKPINTNEFANLAPGLDACAWQLCDMAAPREIPTPIPGGAIDVLSEWRITSGWGLRPETITIISATY